MYKFLCFENDFEAALFDKRTVANIITTLRDENNNVLERALAQVTVLAHGTPADIKPDSAIKNAVQHITVATLLTRYWQMLNAMVDMEKTVVEMADLLAQPGNAQAATDYLQKHYEKLRSIRHTVNMREAAK